MHRHNRKYRHSELLLGAVGQPDSCPILGEVQHSLFVSTHHFTSTGTVGPPRRCGREGIPFFSWNDLLPFNRQVPIGDPLLYRPKPLATELKASMDQRKKVLIMPKFNAERKREERIAGYRQLVDVTRERFPHSHYILQVHPDDRENIAGSSKLFSGIEISAVSYLQVNTSLYLQAPPPHTVAISSDYFGAHVFRANLYLGIPSVVSGQEALHSAIDRTLFPLFESYLAAHTDFEVQLQISEEVLGQRFMRNSDELRELLIGRHPGSLPIKLWVAGYKYQRQLRVKTRNSRWLGSSPIAKLVRKKFLRPVWREKALTEKTN